MLEFEVTTDFVKVDAGSNALYFGALITYQYELA